MPKLSDLMGTEETPLEKQIKLLEKQVEGLYGLSRMYRRDAKNLQQELAQGLALLGEVTDADPSGSGAESSIRYCPY